jgi:hypothetical protein
MLKEMNTRADSSEFDCRVMKWATQGGRCHDLGSMDGLPQEYRSKPQIHKAGD